MAGGDDEAFLPDAWDEERKSLLRNTTTTELANSVESVNALTDTTNGTTPDEGHRLYDTADRLNELRAELLYLASDLNAGSRRADPSRAAEMLALSDLIAAFAARWR